MTPMFAYLVACGFVGFLIVGAVITEQTEWGRRLSDRLIDWIIR